MKCSLVITTYDWTKAMDLVLQSVSEQSTIPNEVVIADDGSDDRTQDLIQHYQQHSNLNIIHSWQEDKGFRAAKSRNKAIAKASSEYIVLIDGDMILHPEFIADHVNRAKTGFFIQGPRVLLSKEKSADVLNNRQTGFSLFESGLQNRKNAIRLPLFLSKLLSRKKDYLKGIKTCNMSFFREDCLSINGFNEDFTGWGREDSEFIVRIMNHGVRRNTLRFQVVQYHIWHNENSREYLQENERLLERAIDENITWCNRGIDQYLEY